MTAFGEGRLGSLLHLDLSECSNLDDAGVMAVARTCPNLGSLTLAWCWEVTDVGIWSIVNKCRSDLEKFSATIEPSLLCRFMINLNLCGVVRLLGDFIPSLSRCLVGLQLLDLEQCPDIQLTDLQQLLGVRKVRGGLVFSRAVELQYSGVRVFLFQDLHIKDYYGERVVVGRIFGDFDILNNLIWSSDDEI